MTPILEAGAAAAAAEGAGWSEVHVSPVALVGALLGGIVLYAVLRRARAVLRTAPMGASRRTLVRRARPIVEATVVVGYLVFAVPFVLQGPEWFTALMLVLLMLGFVLVAWFAIRDGVSGLFLKGSEFCKVGDFVVVDGIKGRVRGLGFRVLAVETEGGEEAFIPYSRISRQSLVCIPEADGDHRHTFELHRPVGMEPAELRARIARAALTCHWATASKSPDVEMGDDRCIITVYAIDGDRARDVETHLRRAFDRG